MQIIAILIKRLDIYLSLPLSKLDWRKENFLSYHEYIEFYFSSTIKEVLLTWKLKEYMGCLEGSIKQAIDFEILKVTSPLFPQLIVLC